ncbi:hypothetical protein [uncultured Enterovirga sp.]|uniref:hypothetical protein n=1 Tax=uncultured Enterovirga sp. TaxID=2026352 RepID=UPI0035CC882C
MRRILLLLGCAFLSCSTASAYEVVPAEKRIIPYVAELPTCGDPSVLAEISTAFAEKEAKFWNSNLTIVEYSKIKPLAWRPWGLDLIPRRYCTASAYVSSGRHHRVDYSVREDTNFIGAGWGVEWCVTGLDRNLAYSPACRMARP